jgi:hypothetical protein
MENHRTIMGKYGDIPEDGCFSGKHIYKWWIFHCLSTATFDYWIVVCALFFCVSSFCVVLFYILEPFGASLICLYSQNKS